GDASVAKNAGERLQVRSVNDQQLVLVELHFNRLGGRDDRYAGAAVVQKQVLEVAKMALQDQELDVLAVKIAVPLAVGIVAGFQDDIDGVAERIEQIEEAIEQLLAREGGDEHRHTEAGLGVAVQAHAEPFLRHDLQIQRRPNRVGQP